MGQADFYILSIAQDDMILGAYWNALLGFLLSNCGVHISNSLVIAATTHYDALYPVLHSWCLNAILPGMYMFGAVHMDLYLDAFIWHSWTPSVLHFEPFTLLFCLFRYFIKFIVLRELQIPLQLQLMMSLLDDFSPCPHW
ncbi:hypothetical protein O6H91_Y349300 [Diphasiastrum complanatum]|nr:hypothetical protein O6H91_Y349300 [Diphasiastrum complanatum]